MTYLLLLLMFPAGNVNVAIEFKSMAECERALGMLPQVTQKFTYGGTTPHSFAAACTIPTKNGKDV